jgi:hypothetical protein
MKTRSILLLVGFLSFTAIVGAQNQKSDFSGTWAMDKNRSFTGGAALDQTMTISHAGVDFKMDAKLVTTQGEREVHEAWVLDGEVREVTPTGAAAGVKAKRKAYWLPDNRRLVLVEETTTVTPKGSAVQQIMRKYSLSSDGATLTVDYYVDRPQGSGESKRVFTKQ